MSAGKGSLALALATVLLVSACGDSGDEGSRLMNLRSSHNGPDEFSILPTKPLQIPANFNDLPQPQPGAANLVDPNPLDDAVIALGGRPGAGAGDAALVSAAGRHGVSETIRQDLAADDAAFRAKEKPRLLERLFGSSSYRRVYSGQTTTADAELDRFRAAGARTPAAPPPSDRKR